MLQLGSLALDVDGVTVFSDDADPDLFWYLPAPVRLAERPDDHQKTFTLITYKPAAVAGGAQGGGFLMFQVNLRLDDDQQQSIKSALSRLSKKPRLSVVPFDEGEVQCVALNLQGSAGAVAAPGPPGTFNAVEKILGAMVPSMFGDNDAIFSLVLDQDGAIIMKQAFEQGAAPVGVIYKLKFTGLRPSMHVRITADLTRVYSSLTAGLSAQIYWVKVGLDAAFQKLVQDGAIHIEVKSFTTDTDKLQQEQWALDFFKDKLLSEWFTPSLSPGQAALQNAPAPGGTPPVGGMPGQQGGANQHPVGIGGPGGGLPGGPGGGLPGGPGGGLPGGPGGGLPGGPGGGLPGGPGGGLPGGPGGGLHAGPGGGGPVVIPIPPPPPGAIAAGPQIPPVGVIPIPHTPVGVAQPGPVGGQIAHPPAGPPAAGQGGPVGATPVTPPAKAGDAAVAFKLSYLHQEEEKHLVLELDRADAVQRTYAPQGFFSLLARDLAGPSHFVDIDLDDPFFRTFAVSVRCSIDFARYGLISIDVALDYGDDGDPQGKKHADFIFDATHTAEQRFEVFVSPSLATSYNYEIKYNFDGSAGWLADDTTYVVKDFTADRTMELNLFNHFALLEITVQPGDIDPKVLASTDVHLSYPSNGEAQTGIVTVKPDSPAQQWRVRTRHDHKDAPDRHVREYAYQLIHTLVDGSVITSDPVITTASTVSVADPFPGRLDIDLVPAWDSATISRVFVDIVYDDPPNAYHREERRELVGTLTDTTRVSLALRDSKQRTFTYRTTFVGTDNQVHQGEFASTSDSLLSLRSVG